VLVYVMRDMFCCIHGEILTDATG